MTFLTHDSVEAGQPQFCARDPSQTPLALAQHLLRPQIDSVKAVSMITRWLAAIWQADCVSACNVDPLRRGIGVQI